MVNWVPDMDNAWILSCGLIVSSTIMLVCALVAGIWLVIALRRAMPRVPRASTPLAIAAPPANSASGLSRWTAPACALVLMGCFAGTALVQLAAISTARRYGNAAEWTAWQRAVADELARATPIEDRLRACLAHIPSAEESNPAAQMRRDQQVAGVLMKNPDVCKLLQQRFSIYGEFLGTGFANPSGEEDYAQARVHEFIIENQADSNPGVWMWKMSPDAASLNQTVGDFLKARAKGPASDTSGVDDFRAAFAGVIVPRVEKYERALPPVIRFAQFPAKFYSGMLGRKEAKRVFACGVADVWHMPVRDAAKATGFISAAKPEDTFFIWLVVPKEKGQVVPASWNHILKELPAWLSPSLTKVH